ncbi:MAG: glycosyltransferase [Gammaproteobacteria bacterium]|nr:glycosyltransferase [Gammaproteobacteria bacterium]MDH3409150.1 glycosyltransferase [Gammaproteobacteria bacterium]
MKILHVETGRHLYGGPQQVLYLVAALIDRSHDCTLVCPPGSGVDAAARAAGIPVRNLFCAGDLDLPFAYRLTQYLQTAQPDLVHCHSRRGADMLGGLAASLADIPAIVSRRVDSTEMRLMAALRYRPFRKIIAISEAIAAILRDHDVDAARIEVIRSAVDTERFLVPANRAAFRAEFGIPEAAIVIAAAGQLIPRKGHRYLLQAVADLRHTHPGIRLIIFGEGYLNNQLRAQAAALGLGDIAQFAGFRDDLDDYMTCFDIFAHPALAEGLGVATLKAAAAGVPVVGFNAGGLAEAVSDGETGILVPAEDVEALRDAIARLIDQDDLRARMGAAGRERMQKSFSIDTMVNKHVELYESVLNG